MKIEEEINNIKERNKRVELDKKWETSLTRKIFTFIYNRKKNLKSNISVKKITLNLNYYL